MNTFFTSVKRWFLLSLLILIFFTIFYFHLYDYLNLHTLTKYQYSVQQWASTHYKSAVMLYIMIFVVLIACAIPAATFLSLLGGCLFGLMALFYAVFATTLGGIILFLAVRTAIGARLTAHSTGWIKKMEHGFRKNAFNYLLMLRLVPVFPCWISNISAGALNVPLKIFALATVIGITPATLIYVLVGRGLDKLLNNEKTPNLDLLFTPSIFFPLLGLAFLSLFPVFYRNIKKLVNKKSLNDKMVNSGDE